MQFPSTETYEHDGKQFQITTTASDGKFEVVVTLDAVQVSPKYVVELTVHLDYFMKHESSLIGHLVDIARSDLKNGIYYKG